MESPIGFIKELIRTPDLSVNTYQYPYPKDTKILRIEKRNESHSGPFKGAIDFIVPLGTPIIASLDGIVTAVVDSNDKYGTSRDFSGFLNYITVGHINGEFSQYAHLAKGSSLVKPGEAIHEGQLLGVTGNSGWMYEPHLHFFVFKSNLPKSNFIGLIPRFK